jgi:hypothetical protein
MQEFHSSIRADFYDTPDGVAKKTVVVARQQRSSNTYMNGYLHLDDGWDRVYGYWIL